MRAATKITTGRWALPAGLLLCLAAVSCEGADAPSSSAPSSSGVEAGGEVPGGPVQEEPRQPEEAAPQASEGLPGDGHLAEVHLGPERAAEMGIRVEPAPGGTARSVVSRPATLRLDPDRKALVGPRVASKVVRVTRNLGDRVEEGDTLAILSSVELGRARSSFLTARARARTAEEAYRRERSLHERDISSEAELLEDEARLAEARAELEAAREALRLYGLTDETIATVQSGSEEPLSRFALRSPVAGRVQHRDVSPGQTVGPGETPIHVADISVLWVMIDAFDRDVPLLQEGQAVRLSVRSLPDRTFEGRIDWISYELDPRTRTLRVRARVDNQDGVLRAGMYGTARIELDSEVERAVVPVDALQTLDGTSVVFVPGHESGAFRPVEVRAGAESEDGRVELLSGLQPGDPVVVEGAFDLMSAATAAGRSATHSH